MQIKRLIDSNFSVDLQAFSLFYLKPLNFLSFYLVRTFYFLLIQQIIPFRRRAETQHVDCGRLLSNDKVRNEKEKMTLTIFFQIYMKQFGGSNRTKMRPSAEIDMSCE